MTKKLLLVDDDRHLTEPLKEFLEQQTFDVNVAPDGDTALQQLKTLRPALITLDVMMPSKNGYDVCAEIRAQSDVPIIMLTARGDVGQRVYGLERGADDYLPKPFDPRELLARIYALLRRSQPKSTIDKCFDFGDLVIDVAQRSVVLRGQSIPFTTAEFKLLVFFATNPGKVLSRDQVSEYLSGHDLQVFSRSVDILLSRVRGKLGDNPKSPRFFKTIWGSGYIFTAEGKAN